MDKNAAADKAIIEFALARFPARRKSIFVFIGGIEFALQFILAIAGSDFQPELRTLS